MKSLEKQKKIVRISLILVGISMFLVLAKNIDIEENNFSLAYEYINTKDMASVEVAYKKALADGNTYTAVAKDNAVKTNTKVEEAQLQTMNNSLALKNKVNWYLPVENGIITQTPSYNHVAFDITSTRGVYETIFPIANGTISGIYTDNAGALIVTVHHVIDGVNYTSQYVHLSSYAPNIYVGKEVTINDALGQMGATGIATGVHLHIAVIDCTMFDPNDANCSDLGRFYRYIRLRYTQGFVGLYNVIDVPYRWYSR